MHCHQVRIGEHNLATTGETKLPEKTISVARALRHEGYDGTLFINDLALLELSEADWSPLIGRGPSRPL